MVIVSIFLDMSSYSSQRRVRSSSNDRGAGSDGGGTGADRRTRSIGLSILWFILTIGIYGFYWVYKTHEEIKRYSGNGIGGVIGLVIYIVISPVTFFVIPSEGQVHVRGSRRRQSPVRGIHGLWILLPLIGPIIWFVQVQGALNRYWESKGAPPP
jgi:hypothetical protein